MFQYSCFLLFFDNHASLAHDNFAWLLVTMALFNQQESVYIFLINHDAYTME